MLQDLTVQVLWDLWYTLGAGADLAQSAYTRVMQEVRARKSTEAVLKSFLKKTLSRLNPPLLKCSDMTWNCENDRATLCHRHRFFPDCFTFVNKSGKKVYFQLWQRWRKREKKWCFFVTEKYRTALRSQSQSLWVKLWVLYQTPRKYKSTKI